MKKYVKWIFRVITTILALLLFVLLLWIVFTEVGLIDFIFVIILGVSITIVVVCIRLFLDWVWSDD